MLWFDMVVKCQHLVGDGGAAVSTEELKEVFGESLREIGRAVCVLVPWDNPTYVKRIWCQFELHTILELGLEYDIVLPPQQRAALEAHFADGRPGDDKVIRAVSDVDVGVASAREEADRLAILAAVDAGVGRGNMNLAVRGALRGWITKAAAEIEAHVRSSMSSNGPAVADMSTLKSLLSLGAVHFRQVRCCASLVTTLSSFVLWI